MGSNFLRIGIVQPCPVSHSYEEFRNGGDVQHACELLMHFENQADIVCFPDLYPRTGEKELGQKAQELGRWFRTKTCGIDSSEDFATVLGEKEETATITIDIEAVQKFPGYFYYEQQGIE